MTKPSLRNTKTEILNAYNDLLKQLDKLKQAKTTTIRSASQSQRQTDALVKYDTKSTTSMLHNAMVEAIIKNLHQMKSQFSDAASVLQQELSVEAVNLQALNNEVSQYIEQLKSLHQIEFNENSLATLIQKYETTAELQQQELTEQKQALSDELSKQQEQWQKQQQSHTHMVKEQEKELKKQRKREAQEYKYELEQHHSQDQDKFKQQQKAYADELKTIEEEQQQQWQQQEAVLAKREQQAQELKDKAQGLDKELALAIKKAEEEGTGIAKRQIKNQVNLLQKEHEGKQRVFELKIASLEQTIAKQSHQIQELSKQLNTALKQAQDLAVKALEGNANASSLEAMKQIALEQAKNAQKGK